MFKFLKKLQEKRKQAKELSAALKSLKQKEYSETMSLISKIDDHKDYKFNLEKSKWEVFKIILKILIFIL